MLLPQVQVNKQTPLSHSCLCWFLTDYFPQAIILSYLKTILIASVSLLFGLPFFFSKTYIVDLRSPSENITG